MILIALVIQMTGLTLLYRSWRKPQRNVLANTVAWLVILSALWPWINALGAEFGTTLWFIAIPVMSWCFVVFNRQYRKIDTPIQQRGWSWVPKSQVWQNIGKLVLSGPVAFIACFFVASSVSEAFGFSFDIAEANQIVLSFSLLLLLWPVVIYWVIAHPVRWRSATTLSLIALSGPLMLYGLAL